VERGYVPDEERVLSLVIFTAYGLRTFSKTDMALMSVDVIAKDRIILQCCERASPYLDIIY
jgi:hypothetical protein